MPGRPQGHNGPVGFFIAWQLSGPAWDKAALESVGERTDQAS